MKSFIDKLLKRNITPMMYAYLICIQESREFPWTISEVTKKAVIAHLIENGFIKVNGDAVVLKGKALELLDVEPQEDIISLNTCDSWIDEWIVLWPKGVKSGGRPVRASKATVVKKMNSLLLNKKYKVEDIIDCTKAYISDFESRQWKMITCADYFISKSGSSLLEALIEDFDRSEFESNNAGESNFYKLL